MFYAGLLLGLLAAHVDTNVDRTKPPADRAITAVQQVAASGRCLTVGETPDERVTVKPAIAPGPPPVLSFRFYEGKLHHRFGNSELLLDDAGH